MKTQKDFKDLEKANAYVGEINTAFDALVATHKTEVDNLQKSLDEANAGADVASKVQKSLDEALATVAELSTKLDLQEKHGGDGVIVIVKKKSYKLIGNRFITRDGEFTAEEVSKNKALLEEMVQIQSGSLVEIEN